MIAGNDKIRLPLILGGYLALSLAMLTKFRYVIDPDVTSYISIAQKYLHRDFSHAINGHWSPLASWLAVPLLAMHVRPIMAFELMAILVGGVTLVGIHMLMAEIEVGENVRFVFLLSMVPLISLYALTEGNPDLLCLCLLIFYLYLLIGDGFSTNRYRGLTVGFLAGTAYLAKSYNFYFFLLHFTCLVGLIWYSSPPGSRRRTVLVNAFSGALVFILISSVWIGLLSHKFHHLTISTAGDYNFSYIRPGSPGHMVDTDGLLPPPNGTAYSAWEDPASIPKVAWSPLSSSRDFLYFIKNSAKNTAYYLQSLTKRPFLFLTIIFFLVWLVPFRIKHLGSKPFYLFLTVLLHPLGYLMLLFKERYVWLDYILLYILCAFIIFNLFHEVDVPKIRKFALLGATCSYIAMVPMASFFYLISADTYINHMKNIYFLSRKISETENFRHEKIASQIDNWCDDLYLSYYLKARYYGKVKKNITDEKLRKKLLTYKIDYYFVHGALENHLDILKFDEKFGDITIYKVVKSELAPGRNIS
jgi:hypothetical protein